MARKTLLVLLALYVVAEASLAGAEGHSLHPVYGKLRLPGIAASGVLKAPLCHTVT